MTGTQTVEAPLDTTTRHRLAHRYCWDCDGDPDTATAFCGHRSDGIMRPRAERCVVCTDLEPAGCPKCGAP